MPRRKKGPTPKRKVQHPARRTKARGLSGRFLLAALVLGSLVVVATVFAVARNDGGGPAADGTEDGAGPVHVHGLGVNPADGSLLIATHTGTYRHDSRAGKSERTEDSQPTAGPHT